jgi:hypothetical protein
MPELHSTRYFASRIEREEAFGAVAGKTAPSVPQPRE